MQKKQKATYFHDRTAKALPEIEIGQEVRIAPVERNQPWKSEKCVQKLRDRSFLAQTPKHTQRLNRQSLSTTRPF